MHDQIARKYTAVTMMRYTVIFDIRPRVCVHMAFATDIYITRCTEGKSSERGATARLAEVYVMAATRSG